MFYLLDQVAREFRLLPWRENIAYRQELIRSAALTAIDCKIEDLDQLVRELKRLVHYGDMIREDRANFRQSLCYLRRIVRGWHLLTTKAQRDFRTGKIKPWTVVRLVIKAEQALGSHARAPDLCASQFGHQCCGVVFASPSTSVAAFS